MAANAEPDDTCIGLLELPTPVATEVVDALLDVPVDAVVETAAAVEADVLAADVVVDIEPEFVVRFLNAEIISGLLGPLLLLLFLSFASCLGVFGLGLGLGIMPEF